MAVVGMRYGLGNGLQYATHSGQILSWRWWLQAMAWRFARGDGASPPADPNPLCALGIGSRHGVAVDHSLAAQMPVIAGNAAMAVTGPRDSWQLVARLCH